MPYPDIWATSWENQIMPYSNNKGADQPAHPHSLISVFDVRFLDSIIPLVSISEISSLYLAPEAEQAGLRLHWSQTPKTGFLVTRLTTCASIITLQWFHNEWEHYQFSPLYNDISVICKLNNPGVMIWWVPNIKYTCTGSLKLFIGHR